MPKEFDIKTKMGEAQHVANLLKVEVRKGIERQNNMLFGLFTLFGAVLILFLLQHTAVAYTSYYELIFLVVLAGAVCLGLYYLRFRNPSITCDVCSRSSKVTGFWFCGHCQLDNGFIPFKGSTSFIDPCSHCSKTSPAIACSHCGEHIITDPINYVDNIEHVAWFKDGATPVEKEMSGVTDKAPK